MNKTVIDTFTGKYRFLSNFWFVSINYEGQTYPSVEHAYQAAKTTDLILRKEIVALLKPGAAKRLGRSLIIRPDWEEIKLDIMLELLRYKFKWLLLADWLRETKEQKLIEGNNWGDTYWGICNGKGLNYLGELLMQVRKELNEIKPITKLTLDEIDVEYITKE